MLLWTAAAALVVRLFYFVEHSDSAFFAVPLLDETFYDQAARALLWGAPISDVNPGFRPMAYPAFLFFFYNLFDQLGPVAAIAAQHLCGVLITVLVAWLGRRLFQHWAAGAAGAGLYLLAGPPLFFEGQLLIATVTALVLTALAALLAVVGLPSTEKDSPLPAEKTGSGHRSQSLLGWLGAGLVLGLGVQFRPNMLLVAAAFPLMALWNPWRASARQRGAAVLAAALGTVAVLGLAGIWQSRYFGAFTWLPASGGVNFYLGNKAGADGMIPRQDRHTSSGDLYQDSVQLFAEQVYAEETGAEPPFDPGAISDFWYSRTLSDMASRPLDAARLFARKGLLLVWNHEIPNNKSFAFVSREESQWLGILPVRFALLLALAGPGWWLARRRGDRHLLGWTTLLVALYAAGLLLFFVNARFRIPLWPLLAVWAGGGLWGLIETFRRRRQGGPAPLPWPAWVVAILLALVSSINWLGLDPETPHRDYFFRSLALQHKGRLPEALADARRATEAAPWDPAAHFQLGTLSMLLDDLDAAEVHLGTATVKLPEEPRVFNNFGIVLEKKKDYTRAYLAYRNAVEVGPAFSPAWVNLALIELRAGELPDAERHIARAEYLGDRSVALQCARAFLEIKRGRIELGKELLAGAMERDQDLATRLVEEHRRPLVLDRRPRTPPND